jgi:hypothetical protein
MRMQNREYSGPVGRGEGEEFIPQVDHRRANVLTLL